MSKLPGNEDVKMQMQNLGFYLPLIRSGFDWTLDDVGDRLGVSKQTILNIEQQAKKNVEDTDNYEKIEIKKDCMTYAQYVTLRLIIENENGSLKNKNEEMAKKISFILHVLVDNDMDILKDEDKKKIKKQDKSAFWENALEATTIAALFSSFKLIGVISPWAAFSVAAATALKWLKPWKVFEKDNGNEK